MICQLKLTQTLRFFVLLLTFFAAQQANAIPILWKLSDVTFDDGGTLTGFIKLDLDRNPDPGRTLGLGIATIYDFSIKASGGNEDIFPTVTYSSNNTRAAFFPVFPVRPENPQPFFTFLMEGPTPYGRNRDLRISPVFPLDGRLHRVPVLTDVTLGAEECYACSPFRKIVSGAFVAYEPDAYDHHKAVPEPAGIILMGLGLVGLGFMRRKK